MNAIAAGTFNATIDDMCVNLNNLQISINKEVILRWGHEMDHTNVRYAWAGANATSFINAYNQVVNRCKTVTGNVNIKYMWSPLGGAQSLPYYPGNNNVDYVGASLYSYAEYESNTIGKVLNAYDLLGGRIDPMLALNKPIILAEFGVADYRFGTYFKSTELFSVIYFLSNNYKYKNVKAVVYFNEDDAGIWSTTSGPAKFSIDINKYEYYLMTYYLKGQKFI